MTTKERINFLTHWTLLSLAIIPLSYFVHFFVLLLVQGAFGFGQLEWGSYLSQTVSSIAGGAVIGLGTGLYQRPLLRRFFQVPLNWIYTLVIGFALTELIVCIILWRLNLNRGELRFIEFNPLPEALFYSCTGLLIGFMQWRILRKFFNRSWLWIISSTFGWGTFVLINTLFLVPSIRDSIFMLPVFLGGAFCYGAITGTTIVWIVQRKKVKGDQ